MLPQHFHWTVFVPRIRYGICVVIWPKKDFAANIYIFSWHPIGCQLYKPQNETHTPAEILAEILGTNHISGRVT